MAKIPVAELGGHSNIQLPKQQDVPSITLISKCPGWCRNMPGQHFHMPDKKLNQTGRLADSYLSFLFILKWNEENQHLYSPLLNTILLFSMNYFSILYLACCSRPVQQTSQQVRTATDGKAQERSQERNWDLSCEAGKKEMRARLQI